MEAYLDNSATTKPLLSVREIMMKTLEADFGNPSSMHRKGVQAEKYLRKASEQIAKTLKVQAKEIVFTSGGTEANNMALIGAALANKRAGKHIITTRIEHPSVHNPLIFLEEQGFEVTYLPVNEFGIVEKEVLLDALREDTILVSIMYVNNEIGAVEPVAELSKAVKEKKPDVLFHVDAIQAYGKYQIYPKKEGIDLLSVSGHKIHGPKGIGFLYVADKVKIRPILYGGGQQKGMRSGTENVPGIAGLGVAAEEVYRKLSSSVEEMYDKKAYFIEKVLKLDGATVNGVDLSALGQDGFRGQGSLRQGDLEQDRLEQGNLNQDRLNQSNLDQGSLKQGNLDQNSLEQRNLEKSNLRKAVEKTAPHIISVSFDGIRSEVLLHALEEKKIYVSSGSACASNHPQLSGTLKAIGVKKELLDSTLRFSLSKDTTREELDYTLEQLEKLLPVLRKFVRH